jgi:hypothetical protein
MVFKVLIHMIERTHPYHRQLGNKPRRELISSPFVKVSRKNASEVTIGGRAHRSWSFIVGAFAA